MKQQKSILTASRNSTSDHPLTISLTCNI